MPSQDRWTHDMGYMAVKSFFWGAQIVNFA
jgi:hypothetical protein